VPLSLSVAGLQSVPPHHLLAAPFVAAAAAAQNGQMNALTLAERLAGLYPFVVTTYWYMQA
jgi:hypothetical protein